MSTAAPPITEHLLANRELLSLSSARLYLASRVRTRTPLGAAEFLSVAADRERDNYDKRVSVALDCLDIYRQCFPKEYARSPAPYFSTQREHEFYRLVHTRLFPLMAGDGVDVVTAIEQEPTLSLPYIPIFGTQAHVWEEEYCDFWEVEFCFQIALVLGGTIGPNGDGWRALAAHYGLDGVPDPAPPLSGVGWTLFEDALRIEGKPLSWLPVAFRMTSYMTGNPWLDIPQTGSLGIGLKWSAREVLSLTLMRQRADDLTLAIKALDIWLCEDLKQRAGRIVHLWNDAASKEVQSGWAGTGAEDMLNAGGIPMGNGYVAMPAGFLQHIRELEA